MILLIDNYDSFTHNLYQYLKELTDEEVTVRRNDALSADDVAAMAPSRIILSPGPGRPEEAGISVELVRRFAGSTPVLGVCLGLQIVAAAFGARIIRARRIVHGKVEEMQLDGRGLFRSIDSPATFTRYHSLAVDPETVPEELEVSARSSDGEIMGLRHREHLVEAVQFHPESIASETGKKLLRNFLHYRREPFVARTTLGSLLEGRSMSQHEAANFMEELTEGNLSPAQIAGFLAAIAAKGASPEEIAGCASVLQRKRVPVESARPVLDTCGTGGDGLGTFNISSLAALVASACGAAVAKHGNRAVSSKSGSADFYRELGLSIEGKPEEAQELLAEHGFVFLYAPLYHKAMKFAAQPRKELGVKTIMNLLGPLVNPAGAAYQVIGVYDGALCMPMARAAQLLGVKQGMVVHGEDGLDEISVTAPTRAVWFDASGRLEEFTITPEDVGLARYELSELAGGDATENAATARAIIAGSGPPAVRDAVLINSAAALLASGIADTLQEGLDTAREAIGSGAVDRKLDAVASASGAYRQEAVS